MFPNVHSSPSNRKGPSGFNIKGGEGLSSKKRRLVLQSLMDGKADASIDPKKLQQAYTRLGHRDERADRIREIDRGRTFPKSKFIVMDELSGMWRLNGGGRGEGGVDDDEAFIGGEALTRFSVDVANAISADSADREQLDKYFSEASAALTRTGLFHAFKKAFPTVAVLPGQVTKLVKHLQPNDYDSANGEKVLASLLTYAANHLEKEKLEAARRASLSEEMRGGKRNERTKDLFKKLKRHSVLKAEITKKKRSGKTGRHRNAIAPGMKDMGVLYKMRVTIDKEEMARTSAINKLTKAAASFGGKVGQLEGFKGSDMTKNVFAEELKKAFGIRMTADELDAICEIFDLDGDGLISCSEFLNLFFRMKRRVEMEKSMDRQREAEERERKKLEDELEQKRKHDERCAECVERWNEDDLQSAVERIAQAAAAWDMKKGGFAGLRGLQCSGMDPIELREQLWRTFDLTFTKEELGALVDTFDLDGDGTVDGSEFLSMFFRLQKKEQAFMKNQARALKVKRKADQERADLEAIKKEEARMKELVNLDQWEEKDLEEGLRKIRDAGRAISQRAGCGPSPLVAFSDGPPMPPHVFRNNLARFLNVFLSPKQVGAVMAHFDKDGGGTLDGGEFLKGCFDLWREMDREQLREMARHRKAHKDKFDQEKRAREKELEDKLNSIKLKSYSRKEFVSALKKLRKAALMFDDRVNISLQSFSGAPMTPYQFKDLLKRVLKVELTIPELSSLVGHFDSDGDGTISGSEFLSAFFTLRRDEQKKVIQANQREERRQKEFMEGLKEKHKLKVEGVDLKSEYTIFDLRKAIEKIRGAAENFNPRSQTLGGFLSGGAMHSREFKTELKKALGVKLTDQQLSALFNEWDSDGDGTIDSAEFLSHFYKFRKAV